MTRVAAIPSGTYVENSALDEFLREPRPFGPGPFVISEYSLAEKTRLPWEAFLRFVDAIDSSNLLFLRVPPVTQLITGNLNPRWSGPIEYVPLDVGAFREGRAAAFQRLEAICDQLKTQFAQRYALLRPQMADWIALVDNENPENLLDPRKLGSRRAIVLAATLESMGRAAAPGQDDPAAERLRFTLRAWETAMVQSRRYTLAPPGSRPLDEAAQTRRGS